MKIFLVEKRSGTGLFSGLNVILRAIYFLKKNNINDIYVHWENENYSDAGVNLFDKYICHQNKTPGEYKFAHAITFAEELLHTNLDFELNAILNELNFFSSSLYEQLQQKSIQMADNLLGIHSRFVNGHYNAITPQEYFELIDIHLPQIYSDSRKYSFFMASDHDLPLSAMKGKYDFQIFHNQVYRSPFFGFTGHIDWQFIIPKEQLLMDAFIDVYSLSKCMYLICAPSNVSGMAKIFSPSIKTIQLIPTTEDPFMIQSGAAKYGKFNGDYYTRKQQENALMRERAFKK
jgi:hypothetical protein